MPDKGHMETEALLRALEKRIAAEYRKANREITRKVNAYMSEFKRKDKEWREKLENGDITEAEYKAWATGQVMIGKRWEEMRHTLAQDYANTNDLAKQMAFDSMPDVYALNHNYATFEVEKGGKVDTSYTLYDRPTVERLIRDDPKLLPDPRPGSPLAQKLAKHKELRWEEQHVQSVVLQSVLQGESLEQTAKRFTQLTEMNYRQSVRYARTATTGAQNAGRVDGYKRAEKLGINMKQVWLATLDNRTRHEHRVLDGQEVDVGEPFIMDGFKIKYPGDPAAPAHLLYNCRCTVIAKVKGVDFDVSDKTQRDDKIGDMSYEEWKNDKAKPEKEQEKPKEQPKPKETTQNKPAEIDMPAPHDETAYQDEPIKPKQTIFEEMEQNRKEIDKALHDVEEIRRSLDHEVGTIIDRQGNIINVTDGQEHSVSPPEELLKDNIFTHNHPSGGIFSAGDIEAMIADELLELRASTPQGTYYSLVRIGAVPENMEFMQEYKKACSFVKASEAVAADLRSGKLTRDEEVKKGFAIYVEYMAKLGDDFLKENAKKYGYIYSKGVI